MADVGSVKKLFGEDSFLKNGIRPWWETAHNGFVALYVVLLFLFGFSTAIENPSCLPKNTSQTSKLTEAEAAFLSSYCRWAFFTFRDPNRLMLVIVGLLIYCICVSNAWLNQSLVIKAITTFKNAEAEFCKLSSPVEELKLMATQPCEFTENNNEIQSSIRQITSILWRCNAGLAVDTILLREITTALILLANASLVGVLSYGGILTLAGEAPVFDCNLNFNFSIGDLQQFTCTYPWTDYDWIIVIFYFGISLLHCVSRCCGLLNVYRIKRVVSKLKSISKPAQESRRCMLFIRGLYLFSRTKCEREFAKFTKFVLSEDAVTAMMRFYFTHGGKSIKDEGFVELIAFIRGWNYESEEPDLRILIQERNWKRLVWFLNKAWDFDDFSPMENVRANDTDNEGNSILYYALNKEPAPTKFTHRAAARILKYVNKTDRVVSHNGTKISAAKFVEKQFDDDLSYPISLKRKLIEMVEKEAKIFVPITETP